MTSLLLSRHLTNLCVTLNFIVSFPPPQIENERQADADAVDTEAVDLDSFSWNYQGDELPQDWQQQEDSNSGRLRNNDPQNVGAAGGAS